MKHFNRTLVVAGTLVLFFLSGCSKLREEIEHHPSQIGRYCPIQTLTYYTGFDSTNGAHIQFYYDNAGRPLELRRLDGVTQGALDLHFRYDKKGRVSDKINTDPGQTFAYTWEKYSYPAANTVLDSAWTYTGDLSQTRPPAPGTLKYKITLDDWGRAIKYSHPNGDGTWTDVIVQYDSHGNKVVAGYSYDDKVNILQTSPVFQLVFGDFSRNNLIIPTPGAPTGNQSPYAYNSYGLPTRYLGQDGNPFSSFEGHTLMFVSYGCDAPSHAY